MVEAHPGRGEGAGGDGVIPWAPSDRELMEALREGIETLSELTSRFATPDLTRMERKHLANKIRRKLISLERFGIVRRAGEMKRNGIDRQWWRLIG